MSGDQDLNFDFDVSASGPKSARKSGANSSRRRRDVKNDDDDNFGDSNFDSTVVSRPQPLSRKNSKTKENFDEDSSLFGSSINNNNNNNNNKPKVNSKAINSWGEEKNELAKSGSQGRRRSPRFGRNDLENTIEKENDGLETVKQTRREINDAEELDIPEIPDLEETVEPNDNSIFKIAEAPDIQVHQISTYKELDKEFFKEKAFQFLEGNIDVSLLHCGLSTEQQIAEEEDVIWDWTKLFTEVVSVLSVAKEKDDLSNNMVHESVSNGDVFKDYGVTKSKNENSSQNHRREREIDF